MSLRFDWITTARELDLLRDDWARLDDGRAPGAVFRSWEWQAIWWRHLGDDPRRRRGLRVLVGRDETGARGILPLYVEDAPPAPLVPRRRAGFLADGTVGSDYLGLVAPAEDQAELAPAFARRLAVDPMLADADLVELHDFLSGDPLATALGPALCERGWSDVAAPARYTCPYADLSGGDRDAWLAARKDGFGGQLREKRAKLERSSGFDLSVVDTPDQVAAALEKLFALHHARWREVAGGSQAFTNGRVEEFHRIAGRALAARGWARACVLSVAGEPVAAGYGFSRAGRFAYYQAGLDPAWRARSAGTVVLGELVDRAFAEKLTEFDFLRGEEPYKSIWADARRQTVSVTGHPPTPRAERAAGVASAIRTIKGMARAALPEAAVSRLRKVFR
jgi:CelD/BcsL family acetyltransferase involved in cellulose biosynthesis